MYINKPALEQIRNSSNFVRLRSTPIQEMKLITLLLSCLCISAYGQDYLVTNKGDTLRGEIKPMSYDLLDRVQISQNKKKTVFTGLQVREYSYKGNFYRPIQMENAIRFMKLLKSGYLSLYAFQVENQNYFEGRLLAKRDGSSMEVPNLSFKKTLTSFLIECPSVRAKIDKGEYGRKHLDQIIDDFNACIESSSQAIKKVDAIAAESNQKSLPLEKLKKTVEELGDFSSKKDALELINDMLAKIKGAQSVPNYQVEALKGYLLGNEATKEVLEKVLTSLQD